MNEHIEAYLKQHYCRDYFNTYGETIEDDHYFMYREEVEGLIELVVRECVAVCAGIAAVRAGYNDADGRDTAYSCGDMIKEHFGVEA